MVWDIFVTLSCGILSFEDVSSLRFSYGSLFVLLAAICWGFENNCTRKISSKDPLQIVLLKRNIFGYRFPHYRLVYWRTDRGTLEYRCCSLCRICGIRIEYLLLCICTKITWCSTNKCLLCRCSIYSGNFSLIIFREIPDVTYFVALVLMILGAWLSSQDKPLIKKLKMSKGNGVEKHLKVYLTTPVRKTVI